MNMIEAHFILIFLATCCTTIAFETSGELEGQLYSHLGYSAALAQLFYTVFLLYLLGLSDEYEDYYDYYDDKEWSDWSPCCNGNSKRRKLVTKDGELVNLTETLSCKKNECPGKWSSAL